MLPKAHVIHELPHRVRLQIPSRRRDWAYFSELKVKLSQLKTVKEVRTNPVTASVLILFRGAHDQVDYVDKALGTVVRYAKNQRCFEIRKKVPTKSRKPWSEDVFDRVEQLDHAIRNLTEDRWNLSSLAAAGLVGLSFLQAFRGSLLPPALTLFEDAWIRLERSRSRAPSENLENEELATELG